MALSTPTVGPALQFRLLGIPFRLELPFLVVLGVLGYAGGRSAVAVVEWIVLGGLSIAAHELGHAVAFRAFGVAPRIRLHGWGGETHGAALTPARDLVVSAAGPVTGLAIGAAVGFVATLGVLPDTPQTERWVGALLWINVGWSAFNLLPIRPLDGSGIARSVLTKLVPSRAAQLSIWLSIVVAVGVGVASLAAGQVYLALFALYLGIRSWQERAAAHAETLERRLWDGWLLLERRHDDEAIGVAQGVLDGRASPEVRHQAIELIAWASLARGDTDAGRAAIARLGDGLVGSDLLKATARVLAGDDATGFARAVRGWRLPVVLGVATMQVVKAGLLDDVLKEARALDVEQGQESLFLLAVGLEMASQTDQAAAVRGELDRTRVGGYLSDPDYRFIARRRPIVEALTA